MSLVKVLREFFMHLSHIITFSAIFELFFSLMLSRPSNFTTYELLIIKFSHMVKQTRFVTPNQLHYETLYVY